MRFIAVNSERIEVSVSQDCNGFWGWSLWGKSRPDMDTGRDEATLVCEKYGYEDEAACRKEGIDALKALGWPVKEKDNDH